ncbi:PIN domain-like protein [Lophiotrema nucula]|uniref:PIN domain-like protein n=1 Tax=Lophiotrema nucula TaxID=690887 RepID=A0A6A5ZSI3_9PLEO|nr:PIN domain-like protein [Lophiotrema nucula]
MGISGLLPLLKSIHKPCNLKKFSGQTIGVDGYGWLHRGTAACAIDLALDKPTAKFVDFCMNRVRMLIHFGVTPYLVFDGDNLPSKAGTEKERRDKRKEAKRLGLELLKMGKTSQAHLELQKAVDVTAEMARQFIEELKHHNIQYVVAPYEADSQLVYLERKGIIDSILSEDSDLLVFGAKCLITKLDKYGECVEVNRNLFTACREISLAGWTDADFRRMAMLSGCDYLPGIGKMGLKTAHRMLRKHKTLDRVVKVAQFDGQFKVAPGYMESFIQAENTFLYQWVYCPLSKQLVNLTTPENGVDVDQMPYIGAYVREDIAFGVARGDLHPRTKESIKAEAKERPFAKPLRPAQRVSSSVQTPDGKQSKPIDSFFKPKRTPLAELDPNMFTASPSQQNLLEQHRSASWSAMPAPHSQSQQPSVPRTAPIPPPRRAVSEVWNRRASAPNAGKRQRLCSDSTFDTPASTEKSPFFGSSIADPSPSVRPSKKSRRKTSDDFGIFSDASTEEAMAEAVADLEQAASQPKKKKISIFKDDFQCSVSSNSQSTTFSRSITSQSQDLVGTLTPATSFGTPEPERDTGEESVFSAALSSQAKDLWSKFSYGTSTTSQSLFVEAIESKPGNNVRQSISATAIEENADATDTVAVPETPRKTSRSISRQKTALCKEPAGEQDLDPLAFAAMEAEVIVTASESGSPTKRDIQGSEDLIVPDSDAESITSPRKPMFNLGRFAFAG